MWCRFGNQWGEQSPQHCSPLQLGTANPAGTQRFLWGCSAGSDGSCWALCCLTQKQMFSASEAVATTTAAEGQDSHRKGSKAKLRERFLQNCKHWAIPLHPKSVTKALSMIYELNCLNVDISVKLKTPSLSGLNLMLILWVNVRRTKMSSP